MWQSAASASFQEMENWEELLIRQSVVLPFRGTSTGWRNGQRGNSQSSGKGNANSYIWEETTPFTNPCWGWKAAWRRTQRSWWTPSWAWGSKEGKMHPQCCQQGWGWWLCTSEASPWVWDLELTSKRKRWTCWSGSSNGPWRWSKDQCLFHAKRAWESWHCSLWKREGWGDLISVQKYLTGRSKEEAKLFSVVCSDRTRGNVHRLKYRKFCLNARKNFLALRVVKHWHSFLIVSIHEDIQNATGQNPGQAAVADPAWAERLDKVTFRGTFQPQPFYDLFTYILHQIKVFQLSKIHFHVSNQRIC